MGNNKNSKKIIKYSTLTTLSFVVGFVLHIIFENLIYPIAGLILGVFFFVKQLKAM